jgi:SpoVK/Ycf46/Vps4 family AAA+-type ATPase
MVDAILTKLLPQSKIYYRHTLTALCKESLLIEVMEQMPKEVEFSSLPKLHDDGWRVSISVASDDEALALESFEMYEEVLKAKDIAYTLEDEA